ncbi:spore coat associated protein CotJA [Paenibacillus sp. TAF43_2]|uniref:spore coat associated protein CotJA n=1 Tax=Paenibacillus sp. TAF43_2 TaxID=3233069 RepID=UPI003F979023
MNNQVRYYKPFISPLDPCPPIKVKSFSMPPQLFITFQPPNLPQFSPHEALRYGTLWPMLYSPYDPKNDRQEEGD